MSFHICPARLIDHTESGRIILPLPIKIGARCPNRRVGGRHSYVGVVPTRRLAIQYILLLYFDESGWFRLTPEQKATGLAAYEAYMSALNNAGVLRGSNSLQSSALATQVHVESGKTMVLDGPFIDSKEQLGGYFVIEVPDLGRGNHLGGQMSWRGAWFR